MKEMKLKLLLFLLVVLVAPWSYAQVGIGTNEPDANAILDLRSTTKGLLVPRVVLDDVNTYLDTSVGVVPVQSMLVYNTGTNIDKGFYYWDIITVGVPGKWNKIIDDAMLDAKLLAHKPKLANEKIFVGEGTVAEEVGLRDFIVVGSGIDKKLAIKENTVTSAMLSAETTTAGQVLVSTGAGGGVVWEKKSEFKLNVYNSNQLLERSVDGTVIVKPQGTATVEITLPKGDTGERYTIKKGNITAGTVKIVTDPGTASDEFAGGFKVIQGNVPYQSWTVVWDGTAWQVLNSF